MTKKMEKSVSEKIALGFQACVDYELKWDYDVFKKMVEEYQISDAEIKILTEVKNFREILISSLGYMKANAGGEIIPLNAEECNIFAEKFNYEVTLGGTATRAALAINKLGYKSSLHVCLNNSHVQRLLPREVESYYSVPLSDIIYPHVILQYPRNLKVEINDIKFETKKPNRIMISNDFFSANMQISEEFSKMTTNAEVFLVSCFSQVLDFDVLKDCLKKVRSILLNLPKNTTIVFEDGCYAKKDFRFFAHEQLKDLIHVISMNEDELQEYIGRNIDILNANEVAQALEEVYSKIGVPTIVVHSYAWALAYGKNAQNFKESLESGIALASTRFCWGDNFGTKEYEEIKNTEKEAASIEFIKELSVSLEDKVYCSPSINLNFVKTPTVVGLGDFFVGGSLLGLTPENRKEQ